MNRRADKSGCPIYAGSELTCATTTITEDAYREQVRYKPRPSRRTPGIMNGRCVLHGASGVSDPNVAMVVKVGGSVIAFLLAFLLALETGRSKQNDLCAHIGCTPMPCDHVVLEGVKLTLNHMSFYSPIFPFPSQC